MIGIEFKVRMLLLIFLFTILGCSSPVLSKPPSINSSLRNLQEDNVVVLQQQRTSFKQDEELLIPQKTSNEDSKAIHKLRLKFRKLRVRLDNKAFPRLLLLQL